MGQSIVVKVMCLISHKWSPWETVQKKEKKDKCYQKRVCERCGQVEKRKVDHTWGEWETVEKACYKSRTCHQCKVTEYSSSTHSWGNWEKQKNCETYRICLRCGQKETGEVEHAWSEWRVSENNPCSSVRECIDCHKLENQVKHDYHPISPGAKKDDKVDLYCNRCSSNIPFHKGNRYWCNTCQGYVNIREFVDCDNVSYGFGCEICDTKMINYDLTVE